MSRKDNIYNDRRRRRMGGGAVAYDSDAQAYFDAVTSAGGSLTELEKSAYNTYRVDAKNNADAWDSVTHADYPMLGSSVDSCKINAKNPGTFDGTFVNTLAGDFTSTGWQPNGTDSYMTTGFIPSIELTIQSATVEYYSRTDANATINDWGANAGQTSRILVFLRASGLVTFHCYRSTGDGEVEVATADSLGGFTFSRISTTDYGIYKNGSLIVTEAATDGTQPAIEFYLGCQNGSGSPVQFSTRECAGALIGDGFTAEQALAQYTARQTMNTTLSRQV